MGVSCGDGGECFGGMDSRLLGNDGWEECLFIALSEAAGGAAGDVVGGVDEEGEGG